MVSPLTIDRTAHTSTHSPGCMLARWVWYSCGARQGMEGHARVVRHMIPHRGAAGHASAARRARCGARAGPHPRGALAGGSAWRACGTVSLARSEEYMPSQATVSSAAAVRSWPSGVRYATPVTTSPSHHSLPPGAEQHHSVFFFFSREALLWSLRMSATYAEAATARRRLARAASPRRGRA